jgi:hypothetical protein
MTYLSDKKLSALGRLLWMDRTSRRGTMLAQIIRQDLGIVVQDFSRYAPEAVGIPEKSRQFTNSRFGFQGL